MIGGTILLYRIEDGRGVGAFSAGLAYKHDEAVPGHITRSCYDKPGPSGDTDELYDFWHHRDETRFACRTKTQLREWFFSKPGRRRMAQNGGLLATYRVPAGGYVHGEHQSLFDPTKAERISAVPCDQL